METVSLESTQTLVDGNIVTIGGKKFTVSIPADYPDQTWLIGVRGGRNLLRGYTNREGLMAVVSWQSGQPVVDKCLNQLRVMLMGNLIEDVTGKKIQL